MRPRITLHIGPTYTVEKTNFTFPKCHVTGYPPPKVTWSKDPGSLPALIVIQDGQLKVVNTAKQDSGLYKCQASNLLGSDSATTLLTVVALPKFIVKPPEVMNAFIRQEVMASCSATGDLRPTVTWSKVNGELPNGRSQVFANGTLKIRSVVEEDSGRYVCTASVGNSKSHTGMQLNVKRKCSNSCSKEQKNVLESSLIV